MPVAVPRARAVAFAAAAALAFLSAAPASGATVLVGDQTVESGHDSNTAGRAEAFRTTASASGAVTRLTVYVDATSAATQLTVGLYASAGAHPGALLGQGTLASPAKGAWDDVTIPSSQVTAGSTYWIAVLSPTGTGTLQFRDAPGTGSSETSASGTLASLPTTWVSGTSYSDGPLSAYGSADAATGQPLLQVTPSSLSLSAQSNGAPASAQVSVSNQGGGTIQVVDSTDAPWLTVTPSGGTAPQTLLVTASAAALAAGTYTGHVTVDGGSIQGSPGTVTVTFNVASASTASTVDWPMVDHDPARTGNAAGETTITPANVASLKPAWSAAVDGKVTAQPLFVKQVSVGGAQHDVVFAATNAGSMYALNAATGAVLWRRTFGTDGSNCAIPPTFGITGPAAIDKAGGVLYVVADDGSLHELSLSDGTDVVPPLQLIAAPTTNKVWGGANLVGSSLYVATASDGCDTAPWRGRVYKVTVGGPQLQLATTFDVVPGIAAPSGGGGIWGYGGVSIDAASGDVYAATGADSNELYTPWADRLVALDGNLTVLGSYLPPEPGPGTYPCAGAPCDVDFGATPLVFQPSGCPTTVAVGNKNGVLYVEKTSDLAASGQAQAIQLNAANDSLGAGGVGGVPAYWPGGNMVVVSDVGPGANGVAGGVVGLSVRPDCTLAVAWSKSYGGGGVPDSTPTIANGIVFVGAGNTGAVTAFDASSGAQLWTSGSFSGSSTFAAPIVADGRLVFASWNGSGAAATGTVRAYAPGVPDTTPPTVSITSPANGATVSGVVSIAASASDDVGVASVQFRVDGLNVGAPVTSAPYSTIWDSSTVSPGTHTLSAVATDTSGNTATSTAVTVTVSASQAPHLLVGDQTVEAQHDSNTAGRAEAFKIQAVTSGALSQLAAYVDSTSAATRVVVGVYADNGGHPGTRLTEGTVTAPVKGAWNTVSVPAATVTAGASYWFAILSPSGTGTVAFRDKAGGTSETSASGALSDLPATWSTGTRYGDGPLSAYGVGN